LVACGAGQSPSSIPSQDSVTIEGAINDAGVARLRQVITADTKTLVVNSPGGEIASAIALGSIVRERGLTVV
ncbi:hypothetical protein, partial [Escherichia coli]|uniref:hypothetical protein n=7 Tax=Pseudomonadota TaxID=1224 RepID=UPI001954597A